MPKSKKKSPAPNDKIIAAALKLSAQHAWHELTFADIAKAAKISATEVEKLFADKNQILGTIVSTFDDEVKATFRKSPQGSARDRLFEILMARFDILQKHRAAILSIMRSVKNDPSILRVLIPAQTKSMRVMMQLAQLPQTNIQEISTIAGLMIVYAATLQAWKNDTTTDMSATMAALDKSLRLADRCADIIFRLAA